jgi:hypothetical protein
LVALLLAALFGASCNTNSKPPKYFVQFYMESPGTSGVPFTLPESGLKYYRKPQPFLTAADVLWVEQGFVDVGTTRTVCVFFQFTVQGTHELDMQTAENVGRKIFLFTNDKPAGVRFIDQGIQNGRLFMFVEVSDPKKFEEFVKDLQDSQKIVLDVKKKL